MRKRIKLSDVITTKDNLKINQKASATGLNTLVKIIATNTDYDGSKHVLFKTNKTSLPGRTKILEDVFPIAPNMEQHIFINDNVLGEYDITTGRPIENPVTIAITPEALLPRNNKKLFARRKVEYWCAGDGAMNKTILNQSFDPHSTDSKLYHMIPFRFIKEGEALDEEIRKQYKFEVHYPKGSPYYGYVGYYFKKINFVSKAGINMMNDNQPYTPNWSDTIPDLEAESLGYENAFKGNKNQSNYIDMGMNITSEEFKEWFTFNDGTLGNATISEIGLVCGVDCITPSSHDTELIPVEDVDPSIEANKNKIIRSEVYDSELFAHLTFDPYQVSRENFTIDIEYRVFS